MKPGTRNVRTLLFEKEHTILKYELWLVAGHVYCVWVRLCSHHTWIIASKSWITAELLRRVYPTTLTKQMGSLSIILPAERLNRGKEARVDLSFQKFDLNPQSHTVSATKTRLRLCVLMDVFSLWSLLILSFIVQKIIIWSHWVKQLSSLSKTCWTTSLQRDIQHFLSLGALIHPHVSDEEFSALYKHMCWLNIYVYDMQFIWFYSILWLWTVILLMYISVCALFSGLCCFWLGFANSFNFLNHLCSAC